MRLVLTEQADNISEFEIYNVGLRDLVSSLSRPDNRQKVAAFLAEHPEKLECVVLTHLAQLADYIKIQNASPGDILKGMMKSFMNTSANVLINNPLHVASDGITQSAPQQEGSSIIDSPDFWRASNDTQFHPGGVSLVN